MKKKIENIWYYYKVPIIIAIAVIYLVTTTIIDKKTEPKFDHSIAMISTTFTTEENMNKVKESFEDKYGGTFDLKIYNIKLCETGQDEVTISQLDLDLRQKISEYLIIEDLDAFKNATNNLEINNVALIKDIDWLNGLGIDQLYFATR